MEGDSPVARANVDTMSDNQMDAHLEGIRTRRMSAFIVYQEAQAIKHQAYEEKLSIKLDKQINMLKKEIEQLDKKIIKVEARVLTVRSLRLEIGEYG